MLTVQKNSMYCSGQSEPGTVMVLTSHGMLEPSSKAYDKRVAGIVSGAGNFKTAIILDKHKDLDGDERVPIALIGKVFCQVDASYSPIDIGDLLTTSPTIGHAMKATDYMNAFGTIIGKALSPLQNGKSMIPVLVALQ